MQIHPTTTNNDIPEGFKALGDGLLVPTTFKTNVEKALTPLITDEQIKLLKREIGNSSVTFHEDIFINEIDNQLGIISNLKSPYGYSFNLNIYKSGTIRSMSINYSKKPFIEYDTGSNDHAKNLSEAGDQITKFNIVVNIIENYFEKNGYKLSSLCDQADGVYTLKVK